VVGHRHSVARTVVVVAFHHVRLTPFYKLGKICCEGNAQSASKKIHVMLC
jgi:hypothetical protein